MAPEQIAGILVALALIIMVAAFLHELEKTARRPKCPPGGHSWEPIGHTYRCRTCAKWAGEPDYWGGRDE